MSEHDACEAHLEDLWRVYPEGPPLSASVTSIATTFEHAPCVLRQASELACGVRVAARGKYDRALLLGLGIGQRLGEAGDREVHRRRAIVDRRNDTGPQEDEGSEQTHVPFALSLPFDNFGEGGNAAEPDIVIRPIPGALAMAVRRASGSWVSSLALRPCSLSPEPRR